MRIPGVRFVQGRNDYTDADGHKFGIAIHNTSNDASDEGESSYATRRTDGISSHLYVDSDSVTQSLDTEDCAGHAGSWQGNGNAIAVEITGGNGWSRDRWLRDVAWDKLGAALAYLISHEPDLAGFQVRRASVAEMRANPKVKAFYGHDDMRLAWGGTTHTDPGPTFPWDRLFQAVTSALTGEDDDMPTTDDFWNRPVPLTPTKAWQADTALGYTTQTVYDIKVELAAAKLRDEAILRKVTEDDSEFQQIKAHIDAKAAEMRPPSAQQNAQATVEAMGVLSTASLVDLLRRGLGDQRARELGSALSASA